jgi:S-adenosylmethionine synthetase
VGVEREHVAAAIEKHVEGLRKQARVYQILVEALQDEAKEWGTTRESVLSGTKTEKELRELYLEVTGTRARQHFKNMDF